MALPARRFSRLFASLRARAALSYAAVLLAASVVAVAKWRVAGPLVAAVRGDVVYDAIVARHLLAGQGFATNLMPLGGLRALMARGLADQTPWPSAHKFVLAQARLVPFVAAFDDAHEGARVASVLAFLALALVVHRAMREVLADLRAYALPLTVAFVALHAQAMSAVDGVSFPTDALLATATVWLWIRADTDRRALALGAMLGVLTLHRYSFALAIPVAVAATAHGQASLREGARRAGAVAVGAGLLVGPLVVSSLWRLGMVFPSYLGSSLLIHRTRLLEIDPWFTRRWPELWQARSSLPSVLGEKLVVNASTIFGTWVRSPSALAETVVVGALASLGAWSLATRPEPQRRALSWIAALAALFTVAQVQLAFSYAYLLVLLPAIWVLAAAGLGRAAALVDTRAPRWSKRAAAAIAVAVVAVVAWEEGSRHAQEAGLARFAGSDATCGYYVMCAREEITTYLDEHKGAPEEIVSGGTFPWEIAEAIDARVVPLLESPHELDALASDGLTIDRVLVPKHLTAAGVGAVPPDWLLWHALGARAPDRVGAYAIERRFHDGSLLYRRSSEARALAAPIAPCALDEPVDLADAGETIHLGPTFRFREASDVRGWAWALGRHAAVRVVSCRTGRPRTFHLEAFTATTDGALTVTLNGHALAPISLEELTTSEPFEHEQAVSDEWVRDGVNVVTLEAQQGPSGLSVAVSRLSLR